MTRIVWLGLTLALSWGVAQAQVHEYNLDNGLKLLVRVDNRAPVVVSQIWYKVGGSYEYNGITGISHALEHMMFKGTEKHAPGEFSRIIAEHGGRENAFTGKDYTAYFQTLEKSRLPISFEMEADRMRNLTLPEEEFASEIRVVIEERQLRTEDNPRGLTYEQFYATAFVSSPYRQPIIGWMNDLRNMSVADLRDWYRHWYAPNNATLVVIGDVEPDAVHALARKHFGPLPAAQDTPLLKPRTEPPQLGERRVVVKAPAELPFLVMGYKVPVLNTVEQDWEAYALEVLAGILSSGGSSRFTSRLVRQQQIAAAASASYNLYARQDELFVLTATPATGHSVAQLEEALRREIAEVREQLVTEQELERIKAQVVASNVYEKDSMFYQGMQMGILETVGLGWQRMDEYMDKVRAITAEQVRDVARKYLDDDRLTVAELQPLPLDPGAVPPAATTY